VGDVPTGRRDDDVAWGIQSHGEPRWPELLAVLVAMALQLVLPDSLIRGLGNRALIPSLEGVLLLVLLIANPGRISKEESRLRIVGLALIALITVANVVSLIELIHALLYGSRAGGRSLVYASVPIWLTNVIVFGLWFWELDRGGACSKAAARTPAARISSSRRCPRRGPPRAGHRTFSITSTRHSPTRPLSARPTQCRSRPGRNC
jgi:hypothetical protein